MRRLLLLVAVLVFVDTMLYAALTPLLPHFAHELHLTKTRAGTLVAAYAAGALVGGLPGGWASSRLGARRAVLVGLGGMALASVGFAFAGSFSTLFGPVTGAAAALVGRAEIFCALAVLSLGLAIWTLRLGASPPAETPSFAALRRALRNRQLAGGLVLMALPSLLFGILD